MTYSIIARDPDSGQLGAAVQTFNLAVGTWVPWAEAGVGVVATQANADRFYGTSGLDLMRAGYPADKALMTLLTADSKREQRQVAMIDNAGTRASHTGKCCIAEAGSYVGETFCTQANMMARNTVWFAMAEAYQSAGGALADRLLAALDAAQQEGGDLRGKQTAALLVVEGQPSPFPLIDLRVDHDPDPLAQIHRLLQLHKAYTLENQIVDYVDNGQTEPVYDLIAQIKELAPNELYLQCLCALHLERALGLRNEALAILRPLIEENPQWGTYLEREIRSARDTDCPSLDPHLLQELGLPSIELSEETG